MAVIYIVEDDKNIREIESYALRNGGYETSDFECAKDFYESLKKRLPSLVLLDIMLPDEDGLSIIRNLRANSETSKIPVILVTAKTSEMDKVKGLDEGADDYITKPFGIMELISRVKALLRRCETTEVSRIYQVGSVVVDDEKHIVTVNNEIIELTYKEYELLLLLMKNAGSVTSREEIMKLVWGTDFEGESRTLDMHIKTLRQKIGTTAMFIKTIRNVGYIIE